MDATLLKVGYIVHIVHHNGTSIWGKIVAIRAAKGDGYLVDYETRDGTKYTFNPVTTGNAHEFYYRGKRIRNP